MLGAWNLVLRSPVALVRLYSARSPRRLIRILRLRLPILPHRQPPIAVQPEPVEQPACLFRRHGHLLALLRWSFFITRLWAVGIIIVLLVFTATAWRHVRRGNLSLQLSEL